jgi:hypothetical protein
MEELTVIEDKYDACAKCESLWADVDNSKFPMIPWKEFERIMLTNYLEKLEKLLEGYKR